MSETCDKCGKTAEMVIDIYRALAGPQFVDLIFVPSGGSASSLRWCVSIRGRENNVEPFEANGETMPAALQELKRRMVHKLREIADAHSSLLKEVE